MQHLEGLLGETELSAAQQLVTEAGWNQTEADWRVFLDLGQVIAIRDAAGDLAATAATLPYSGGFGWISMVLVSRRHRRQGIATRLLTRCIDVLQEAALVPMLDATPAGREVYRPLGFRDGWPITRWRRGAINRAGDAWTARPLEARDWPALLTLDAQAFGCDRSLLLERLRARSQAFSCVLEHGGRPAGFLLGREGRSATQLGPIVADDARSASALVAFACARVHGPVLLDALDRHQHLADDLEALGFQQERPYTRMALGRDRLFGNPDRLMAIAGPELG